jgi:hypothetical protein
MPEYLQRPPVAIIRKLMRATNTHASRVWDDKMKDGSRSIKVANWTSELYEQAVRHLAGDQWEAKVITTPDGLLRLHITQQLTDTESCATVSTL